MGWDDIWEHCGGSRWAPRASSWQTRILWGPLEVNKPHGVLAEVSDNASSLLPDVLCLMCSVSTSALGPCRRRLSASQTSFRTCLWSRWVIQRARSFEQRGGSFLPGGAAVCRFSSSCRLIGSSERERVAGGGRAGGGGGGGAERKTWVCLVSEDSKPVRSQTIDSMNGVQK